MTTYKHTGRPIHTIWLRNTPSGHPVYSVIFKLCDGVIIDFETAPNSQLPDVIKNNMDTHMTVTIRVNKRDKHILTEVDVSEVYPDYAAETLRIAEQRAKEIGSQFYNEVKRLLHSGAVNNTEHNRGLLFGVALENQSDNFLRGERKSKEYRNLSRF